jgi:membrane protease YdiL (CAAX protease family)
MIPLLVFIFVLHVHLADYGLAFKNFGESLLWSGGLSVIIITINFIAARKPDNLKTYPQIRIKRWTGGLFLISALGWILYLLGYEVMFRGLFLFSCLPVFGYWPSIAINVSIYSLVHIPKGLRESLSSVLLGFILCVLTIRTGSIWIAFVTHSVLALSNDFFSVYFNPDMHLKRNNIIT